MFVAFHACMQDVGRYYPVRDFCLDWNYFLLSLVLPPHWQ